MARPSRSYAARVIVATLTFLAIWQAVVSLGVVSPVLLPSPLHILGAIEKSGSDFAAAFLFTLGEIALAVAVTAVFGFSCGAVLGANKSVAKAMAPILSSLFAVPIIIWYPFFIVFLGIGPESKVAYAATAGFFPIALYTLTAVQNFDERYLVLARSLGATSSQVMFKFVVPLILPMTITGLRIGVSMAVVGVIVTEMLASTAGLGFWISYHRTLFNTGEVYLGVILALSFTLMVNIALTRVERRIGRWKASEREAAGAL